MKISEAISHTMSSIPVTCLRRIQYVVNMANISRIVMTAGSRVWNPTCSPKNSHKSTLYRNMLIRNVTKFQNWSMSRESTDPMTFTSCINSCIQDCSSIYYQIRWISKYYINSSNHQFIFENRGYSTNITFSPEVPFSQFLLQVTSITSLWIPFCMYGILCKTMNYLWRKSKAFQAKFPKCTDWKRRLIIFSCLFGMGVHLWILSNDYLKYQVKSEMIIKQKKFIQDPAISLCLNLESTNMTIRDVLQLRSDVIKTEMVHKLLARQSFTMRPVMKKNLLDYVRNGKKCTRFQTNFTSRALMNIITQDINSKVVLSFTFSNDPRQRSYSILVHDKNTLVRGFQDNQGFLDFNPIDLSRTWRYSMIKTKYLKHPYSNCVSYSLKGMESRSECVERCIRSSLHSETSIAYEQFTYDRMNDQRLVSSEMYAKYLPFCSSKCPNDCNTRLYHTDYKLHMKPLESQVEDSGFETLISFTASFSFMEYLVYAASVTGFWFGLAVYHLLHRATSKIIN